MKKRDIRFEEIKVKMDNIIIEAQSNQSGKCECHNMQSVDIFKDRKLNMQRNPL
ncbi:hypothetical protein FMM74_021385 [Lachnospiraceae bacterium MD308]|nr:hypothetical protein [Lachnospiraceae bacterium MD308]